MTLLRRLDVALWGLPRAIRRALVAPVGAGLAVHGFVREGWREGRRAARDAWEFVMDHVEERSGP